MHAGSARNAAPGLWIAFALNGLFLYLGAIDLLGIEPSPLTTGPYYLVLAAGLGFVVISRRNLLRARLRDATSLMRIWAVAAAVLAAWFLVTATLRSEGDTARDAAFLLVVFCVPSALAVLALRLNDLIWLAGGFVATGLVFACVSAGALMGLDEGVARFTPIDELNPISAASTAVAGALACLALRPTSGRARAAQAFAVVVLAAAAVVPGARGPLVALALGVAVIAALAFRHVWPLLLPAVAVGLALGLIGAERAGSTYYLGIDIPGVEAPAPTGAGFTGERLPATVLTQEPISSASIRRDLLLDALRAIPERPLAGHGIGMLRADSADMRRMVDAGRVDEDETLTHPHNVLVESAYSLGLPGLVLFLTVVATAAIALARLIRGGRERLSTLLAAGFAAAAAVNSSLSGELGMDAWLWVAAAFPVALYAARREAPAASAR